MTVNYQLNSKEIKQILRIRLIQKWLPLITIFGACFILCIAAWKLLAIIKISSNANLPVSHWFRLVLGGVDIDCTYKGSEVILMSWATDILVYVTGAIIIICIMIMGFYRNRLLLKCWEIIQAVRPNNSSDEK